MYSRKEGHFFLKNNAGHHSSARSCSVKRRYKHLWMNSFNQLQNSKPVEISNLWFHWLVVNQKKCRRSKFRPEGQEAGKPEKAYNGLGFRLLCIFVSSITFLVHLWHYRLWSFKTRDTKLEMFFHKNQQTQRKLLNFENWTNGEPQ